MPSRFPICVKLYWDTNRNLPLLGKLPREKLKKVFLHPPGDARPAFPIEVSRLRECLRKNYGNVAVKVLLKNEVLLLANTPYIDEMKQVVMNSETLGYLFFDPIRDEWRFRLGPLGAAILVNEKLVTHIKLPTRKITKGILRPSDYKMLHFENTDEIVLINSRDEIIGTAVMLKRDKFLVIKKWPSTKLEKLLKLIDLPKVTWNDVIKANEIWLHYFISSSHRLIYKVLNKIKGKKAMLFSGGKDSLLTLHILLDFGIEPKLLFNNTTAELPTVFNFAFHYVNKLGFEMEEIKPTIDFWTALRKFGPPARDYRWCTRLLKVLPTIIYFKRFKDKFLLFTGLRLYESVARAHASSIERARHMKNVIYVAPILEWPTLAEWLYLWHKGCEVNPLYYFGYDRLGCFMCPASKLCEFRITKVLHPEIWEPWEKYLYSFAEKKKLPKEWVTLGLWRWLGIGSTKRNLCKRKNLEVNNLENNILNTFRELFNVIAYSKKSITLANRNKIDIDFLQNMFTILNIKFSTNDNTLSVMNSVLTIQTNSDYIKVSWSQYNNLVRDCLKTIIKGVYCINCGYCELVCRNKAIISKGNLKMVNLEKCNKCRLCIDDCTVVRYILPLIEMMCGLKH